MKIKEIIFQCEHGNAEYKMDGYDDANFHNNVIPNFDLTPGESPCVDVIDNA